MRADGSKAASPPTATAYPSCGSKHRVAKIQTTHPKLKAKPESKATRIQGNPLEMLSGKRRIDKKKNSKRLRYIRSPVESLKRRKCPCPVCLPCLTLPSFRSVNEFSEVPSLRICMIKRNCMGITSLGLRLFRRSFCAKNEGK